MINKYFSVVLWFPIQLISYVIKQLNQLPLRFLRSNFAYLISTFSCNLRLTHAPANTVRCYRLCYLFSLFFFFFLILNFPNSLPFKWKYICFCAHISLLPSIRSNQCNHSQQWRLPYNGTMHQRLARRPSRSYTAAERRREYGCFLQPITKATQLPVKAVIDILY